MIKCETYKQKKLDVLGSVDNQSVANIQIFEYICEYSLQIIFIFILAVKKNYEYIHIRIRSRLGL